MKNRCRINYIFLLLSFGIVSTILSTPISAQTQNNSQEKTPETGGSSPYTSGKPGIESANEIESITNDTQTSTSNDTTPMMQELGEETQANSRRTTREPNSRRTTREPNSRRTTREPNSRRTTREPNSRRTTREPNSRRNRQGNQSENILSKAGKALGDLFK